MTDLKFHVAVIEIPMTKDSLHCLPIAFGDGSLHDIENHFYFDVDKYCSNLENNSSIKIDVIILVTQKNEHGLQNLLLMRYFCFPIRQFNNEKKQWLFLKLFGDLKSKNNGLERTRTGGSSGNTEYNKELFQLMKTCNSSPRFSSGVIWLRQQKFWKIFYRGTKDGLVKSFKYCAPKIGGQFDLDITLLTKYTFFREFLSTKPYSAVIIEALSLKRCVSPVAINEELKKMNAVHAFVFDDEKDYEIRNKEMGNALIQYYNQYSSKYNHYTLVTHPVGRHNDTFEDSNTSKLENRFCMHFNPKSISSKIISRPYGRGGNGVDSFVFAVLDW